MTSDKKRVNVYMDEEVSGKLRKMSKRLGQSYSATGALAIRLGLNLLELSMDPKFAAMITQDPEMVVKLERMVLDAEKND